MKKKKHIIESELVDKNGKWKPKASKIAKDADKILKAFIEKHKGELSICAIEGILQCSIYHNFALTRMMAIDF